MPQPTVSWRVPVKYKIIQNLRDFEFHEYTIVDLYQVATWCFSLYLWNVCDCKHFRTFVYEFIIHEISVVSTHWTQITYIDLTKRTPRYLCTSETTPLRDTVRELSGSFTPNTFIMTFLTLNEKNLVEPQVFRLYFEPYFPPLRKKIWNDICSCFSLFRLCTNSDFHHESSHEHCANGDHQLTHTSYANPIIYIKKVRDWG